MRRSSAIDETGIPEAGLTVRNSRRRRSCGEVAIVEALIKLSYLSTTKLPHRTSLFIYPPFLLRLISDKAS